MFNPRLTPNPEAEQYGVRPREGRLSTPFIGEARIDPGNRMDTVRDPRMLVPFLEMESHEERLQKISPQNKELEASEERKRKAKQLEMQRKEAARSAAYGRGMPPNMPQYPSYTPPARPTVTDTYDAYEAARSIAEQRTTLW